MSWAWVWVCDSVFTEREPALCWGSLDPGCRPELEVGQGQEPGLQVTLGRMLAGAPRAWCSCLVGPGVTSPWLIGKRPRVTSTLSESQIETLFQEQGALPRHPGCLLGVGTVLGQGAHSCMGAGPSCRAANSGDTGSPGTCELISGDPQPPTRAGETDSGGIPASVG